MATKSSNPQAVQRLFRDARLERRGGVQLHEQIGTFVRQHIEAGTLKPGDLLPPHRELSQLMKIGEVTIRRALQELADEGLLAARPRSGTFVLKPGERPPTRSSKKTDRLSADLAIGIAFADLASGYPFFKPMLEGIRSDTSQTVSLRLFDLPGPATKPDLHGLDGLIMMSPIDLRLITRCHDEHLPCVALFAEIADAQTRCVLVDYAPAVLSAVAHLRSKKRKRIAVITAGIERFSTGRLTDAYRTALELNDIAFDESLIVHAGYHERDGHQAMRTLLARGDKPDAILCASDLQARGAMLALHEAGLRVPHDVAVVGAGRLLDETGWPTPVTTLDLKFHEVGHLARRTIEALRNGIALPCRQSVRASLHLGQTT